MNILMLTNELRYTCGVTNHLLHLVKGLSGIKGNKLWMICGGGNGIERFNDIDATIVKDMRFLHEVRNLSSYTSAIGFLARFIVKNKIKILHSHTHYAANIAKNASRITRSATLQTNHGLLKQKGKLKHFNADRYIAINEHIYDYLIQNEIARKSNISFIRCGIPVPDSIPKKEKSKIRVLAASRFSHEKGLDIYIKAVAKLGSETKSKAEFFCAGEGELRTTLIKINKETGADISFLGSVRDIYKLLRSCHVLVYPSRSLSEGFPALITEAGANGLVVLSSDFPGFDTVLKNNQDSIIFGMENTGDLKNKLSNVINKFDKFTPIAENLYKKTKEWFSLEQMVVKHQRLYESCLR